jgi:hypothetical protein
MKEEQSAKWELNNVDLKKILKGALIAFGGAFLTQISIYLTSGIVFDWKVWLAGAFAVGINAVMKLLKEN